MTIPEGRGWGDEKRERTRWQRLADERWPDGMDMVAPAYGDGRWATLAWCGALTVHLHPTKPQALDALAEIDHTGCGHACWADHDLIDLYRASRAGGEPLPEIVRAARRVAHMEACRVCRFVYSDQGPEYVRWRHRVGDGA